MYMKLLILILFTHSSTSEHNKSVKATIISEICTNPNMNHTKDEVTGWFYVRYLYLYTYNHPSQICSGGKEEI